MQTAFIPAPRPSLRAIGRMARATAVALTALLAACGKDSTSQPPTQGGGAVTLSIVTGDGQEAAAGSALPTEPVVLATNAAGQPQPGIVVSFAIDSGGGTLGSAQATTGTNGTASPGRWTLGPAEGANVLRVSASGVTSIRIRASAVAGGTPLLTNVSVPRTGGLLTVRLPGNVFDGLTLAVPDTAYNGPTVFSIGTKAITPPALPTGFAQVGPALVITSSQAVASQPMVLTIPVSVQSPDTALSAFFLDPATGTLELVPVAARTATTLSVASRHFTADRMLKKVAGSRIAPKVAGTIPAQAKAGFSPVIIIIVSVPIATLNAATTTGFQPGRDDWEFPNFGTIISQGGECAGMSIGAMYYFYALRDGGPLHGRYNPLASGPFRSYTNTNGLRLTSVLQEDSKQERLLAWERTVNAFALISAVPRQRLYYQSLVMAMQVTKMPQLLTIFGVDFGHAVVAFGSANGVVSFADPNAPGTTRTMTFAGDAFTPFPFSANASKPAELITRVEPVGASAFIDEAALAAAWKQLADSSIGRDRFPTARLQRYDAFLEKYATVDTTTAVLVTSQKEFVVRTYCRTCDLYFLPDTNIRTLIISDAGALLANGDEGDASVMLRSGTQKLGIIEFGLLPETTDPTWNRFRWLTVNYQPVLLEPVTPQIRPDSTLRFTVTATDLAPRVARYTWTFDDGSPTVTTTVPTTTHKYTTIGKYKALVVLTDASNAVLGKDSTVVTVATLPLFGWALRTATVTGSTLPPLGIGPERSDTLVFNTVTTIINRLTGTPSNTAIFVAGVPVAGPTCDAGAILQQAPPGTTPTDSLVSNQFVGLLGTCGDPDFSGTMVMGPLGAGTVRGTAAAVPNPDVIVVPGGSIDATMTARNLAGTFVWNVRYSTGLGTYTVSFTAVQVRPR